MLRLQPTKPEPGRASTSASDVLSFQRTSTQHAYIVHCNANRAGLRLSMDRLYVSIVVLQIFDGRASKGDRRLSDVRVSAVAPKRGGWRPVNSCFSHPS